MPENTHRFRFTQDCWNVQQPKALIFHETHDVISSSLIPARKPLAYPAPTDSEGLSPNTGSSAITHPIMQSWVIGLPHIAAKLTISNFPPAWTETAHFPIILEDPQPPQGNLCCPSVQDSDGQVDGWCRGHEGSSLPVAHPSPQPADCLHFCCLCKRLHNLLLNKLPVVEVQLPILQCLMLI